MKVVAISGVSGSGKTSVVKKLSHTFSCPSIHFDDHTDENTYPKDMKHWLDNGANVSDIKTPKLVNALHHLIAQSNDDFIFIEEPFGRCREPIASLIDYVVLLDMPMEVCLSRVISRHLTYPNGDPLNSIKKYLFMYDDHFREIYIGATDQVRENSDYIIQEVASPELITQSISKWLIKL